jgi:hypothetical protein
LVECGEPGLVREIVKYVAWGDEFDVRVRWSKDQ